MNETYHRYQVLEEAVAESRSRVMDARKRYYDAIRTCPEYHQWMAEEKALRILTGMLDEHTRVITTTCVDLHQGNPDLPWINGSTITPEGVSLVWSHSERYGKPVGDIFTSWSDYQEKSND